MASRKPPTTDEIVALLADYFASGRTRPGAVAAPLDDFLKYAQAKLRTTAQNVRLWVKNIAVADAAPFRIMLTGYGVFTYQLVSHPEPRELRRYKYDRYFGFDGFDIDAPPSLNIFGVPGATGDDRADDVAFILPTATLNDMIISTSKRSDEIKAEKKAAREAELDAADAAHGEAIALLRGLLYRAGIPRTRSTLNIRYHAEFDDGDPSKDMATMVGIEFTGAQLDAIAPVLRDLGIEPRRRYKTPVKVTAPAE